MQNFSPTHVVCADGIGGIMYAVSFIDLLRKFQDDKLRKKLIYLDVFCSQDVYRLLKSFECINKLNIEVNKFSDLDNHIDYILNLEKQKVAVYNLTPNDCVSKNFFDNNNDFFGFTWQTVKENKFLLEYYPFCVKKNVFLGFQSSQENIYPELSDLINNLCDLLPDYNFDFINVNKWANKQNINYNINCKKENYNEFEAEDIVRDFHWILNDHSYFITTDNGLSNIAYFAGKNRFLIDMRSHNPAFFLRWRQNYCDIIPSFMDNRDIARIIYLCIKNPELNGIPKRALGTMSDNEIERSLLYKKPLK
ncbi:MAG: hypothetical protein HC836_24350 [Richelia sp. RM2_1_2]|nr:hypothetical protein [Richelia sp. RM2_1_2]